MLYIYIVIIEYLNIYIIIYIYDLYINSFTQLFHFLKDMAIDCVLYFGAEAIQVLKHIAASAVLGGLLGGRAHPQRDLEM